MLSQKDHRLIEYKQWVNQFVPIMGADGDPLALSFEAVERFLHEHLVWFRPVDEDVIFSFEQNDTHNVGSGDWFITAHPRAVHQSIAVAKPPLYKADDDKFKDNAELQALRVMSCLRAAACRLRMTNNADIVSRIAHEMSVSRPRLEEILSDAETRWKTLKEELRIE